MLQEVSNNDGGTDTCFTHRYISPQIRTKQRSLQLADATILLTAILPTDMRQVAKAL